jgi:hypothetical protein
MFKKEPFLPGSCAKLMIFALATPYSFRLLYEGAAKNNTPWRIRRLKKTRKRKN